MLEARCVMCPKLFKKETVFTAKIEEELKALSRQHHIDSARTIKEADIYFEEPVKEHDCRTFLYGPKGERLTGIFTFSHGELLPDKSFPPSKDI